MDPGRQGRQGEIALKVVKYIMRKRGVTLSQDNMRELGNVAKTIGVSAEELKQFAKPLVQELLEECFAVKQSENQGGASSSLKG